MMLFTKAWHKAPAFRYGEYVKYTTQKCMSNIQRKNTRKGRQATHSIK